MENTLISLKGISKKLSKKLEDNGIKDIPALLKKSSTPEERELLSKVLCVNKKYINWWSKQCDLIRINGIDAVDADLLAKLGIRNVQDLSKANTEILAKMIKTYNTNYPEAEKRAPGIEELNKWKEPAKTMDNLLVIEADDEPVGFLFEGTGSEGSTIRDQFDYIETPDVFFDDMADLIVNLGKGISEAQHALDMNAIKTQEMINDDSELRATGLMATFYAIPDATFNLKMNYSVAMEQSKTGETSSGEQTKPVKRILVSPISAKYSNFFRINENMQSELNLKFVPVPPPSRISQAVFAPDLTGLTIDEAKKTIAANGLHLGKINYSIGTTSNDQDSEVTGQSIAPGAEMRFNDKIDLKVTRKTV
jgi:hypothetical protein